MDRVLQTTIIKQNKAYDTANATEQLWFPRRGFKETLISLVGTVCRHIDEASAEFFYVTLTLRLYTFLRCWLTPAAK